MRSPAWSSEAIASPHATPADPPARTRSEIWLARVAVGTLVAAVLCIGLAASVAAFAGHPPAASTASAPPPAHTRHVGHMAACLDAVHDENELMTCLKQVEAEAQLPASD